MVIHTVFRYILKLWVGFITCIGLPVVNESTSCPIGGACNASSPTVVFPANTESKEREIFRMLRTAFQPLVLYQVSFYSLRLPCYIFWRLTGTRIQRFIIHEMLDRVQLQTQRKQTLEWPQNTTCNTAKITAISHDLIMDNKHPSHTIIITKPLFKLES